MSRGIFTKKPYSMNNNYLRLPLDFEVQKLHKDANTALKTSWIPHFNTNNYSGEWNAISLRSIGGKTDSVMPLQVANSNDEQARYSNTPLVDECPYFKTIIESFKCELEAVRLLKFDPGSRINEHSDRGLGYKFGEFRMHIAIQTNPRVKFFSGGEPFRPEPGECWYLNADHPHAVENLGETPRIHLILDGIRNDWTDNLFKKAGYDFEKEAAEKTEKRKNEIEKMILNFELMNNDIGREMAKEWKAKLVAEF